MKQIVLLTEVGLNRVSQHQNGQEYHIELSCALIKSDYIPDLDAKQVGVSLLHEIMDKIESIEINTKKPINPALADFLSMQYPVKRSKIVEGFNRCQSYDILMKGLEKSLKGGIDFIDIIQVLINEEEE
jgi:hypothetical protein